LEKGRGADKDWGKTTKKERVEAQRTLSHFNILKKIDSSPWDGEGNNILILPSILAIVPNEGINAMHKELEELKNEEVAT
jgi:hypothetical protein